MAIEYTLHLRTQQQPTEIVEQVVREFQAARVDEQSAETPNLLIYVARATPLAREIVIDVFRYEPDVTVRIRLRASDVSRESAVQEALVIVMRLIGGAVRDAVLLFNGENVVVQKVNGRLVLNVGWGFWSQERLSLVAGLPYETAEIESM